VVAAQWQHSGLQRKGPGFDYWQRTETLIKSLNTCCAYRAPVFTTVLANSIVWQCSLPTIQRFLPTRRCGLMSITLTTYYWATVCKTVLRMLSYRCRVLYVLYVTLVYCSQTVGWINMTLGTEVGLRPGHIVLDGNPAPPPPKKRGHSPQFSTHVSGGQTAGCIKISPGTKV